jgi:hypothetical protein
MNKKSEVGRQVGLDFYDLLIETLTGTKPANRVQARRRRHSHFARAIKSSLGGLIPYVAAKLF